MSPSGPVGYFLIDSLDSLLLTGLEDEYKRARDWVAAVSFELDDKFHTFEVRRVDGLVQARPCRVGSYRAGAQRNLAHIRLLTRRSRSASSGACSRRTTSRARRTRCSSTRPSTSPTVSSPHSTRCARSPLPLLLPARCYHEGSCSRPRTAALGPPDELRQPRTAPRDPRRRQQRPDERRRGRVRPPFPSPHSASALAHAIQF